MNYNSPNDIKEFLDSYGFSPQKRFGQNFLIGEDVRRQIISLLKIKNDSKIWEIGPGMGAMTTHIFETLDENERVREHYEKNRHRLSNPIELKEKYCKFCCTPMEGKKMICLKCDGDSNSEISID